MRADRGLRYYIFLIAMYRRTSGSELTATSPSAVPAAAMAIAVTYPSVRIAFSCS
jgi:hypothetical protein